MFHSYVRQLPYPCEVLFDYLALSKDFAVWAKFDGLKLVSTEYENNTPVRQIVTFDVGEKPARMTLNIVHYEKNRELRCMSSAHLFSGANMAGGPFFPFRETGTRMLFAPSERGCTVTTELYYLPKGILGWLYCRFFIVPAVFRELKELDKKLIVYLSDKK